MKFILLSPQPAPKLETAHYRPKTLGEHQQAFLNANNPNSWAPEEEYPELPATRTFRNKKQFMKAMNEQRQYLRRRERERFQATVHTVPKLEGREAMDRAWNNMLARMTPEDLHNLTEVLQIPSHILCSHLKLLTPLEEYELWKRMSPALQAASNIATFMPETEPIIRRHVFGTRTIVSFKPLMEEIEKSYVFDPTVLEVIDLLDQTEPVQKVHSGAQEVAGYANVPKSDPSGRTRLNSLIESPAAARALSVARYPLSLDEWYARRVQLYFKDPKGFMEVLNATSEQLLRPDGEGRDQGGRHSL